MHAVGMPEGGVHCEVSVHKVVRITGNLIADPVFIDTGESGDVIVFLAGTDICKVGHIHQKLGRSRNVINISSVIQLNDSAAAGICAEEHAAVAAPVQLIVTPEIRGECPGRYRIGAVVRRSGQIIQNIIDRIITDRTVRIIQFDKDVSAGIRRAELRNHGVKQNISAVVIDTEFTVLFNRNGIRCIGSLSVIPALRITVLFIDERNPIFFTAVEFNAGFHGFQFIHFVQPDVGLMGPDRINRYGCFRRYFRCRFRFLYSCGFGFRYGFRFWVGGAGRTCNRKYSGANDCGNGCRDACFGRSAQSGCSACLCRRNRRTDGRSRFRDFRNRRFFHGIGDAGNPAVLWCAVSCGSCRNSGRCGEIRDGTGSLIRSDTG